MKFESNKIIPLDKQVNIDPSLVPKIPFSMNVVSAKGGGKSLMLINLLINDRLLALVIFTVCIQLRIGNSKLLDFLK